jgi:hypothetical protein
MTAQHQPESVANSLKYATIAARDTFCNAVLRSHHSTLAF